VDRVPLVLALRRAARAHLALGEPAKALVFYRASAEDAAASGDATGCVIAGTGIGNVLAFQGRWAEAQSAYRAAYDAAVSVDERLRAQLCVNLSLVAREQHRLDEAEGWLAQARGSWDRMSDADRSVWWNNEGLLLMERGDVTRAARAFEDALECAGGHFDRAMIYDNRAELAARAQRVNDALDLSRQAEEHALAAGAPRALAEIYVRMGKLFGLNGDANGVTFFEKALELCRTGGYPLLEGTAHLEYGLFRQSLGEHDDGRPHLLRAREIFGELGSERMAARVAGALGAGQAIDTRA
jgi:tetratricopeptide (TPR) repeat protein